MVDRAFSLPGTVELTDPTGKSPVNRYNRPYQNRPGPVAAVGHRCEKWCAGAVSVDPFSQLIAGTVCTYPGFHSVHIVSAYRILCVDPDDTDREETAQRVRSDLDELGPVVETAASVADAEAALTPETAAVVTEYELPDGTGFDLIRRAEEICPDAGVMLYTDTDPDTIDTTELRGALTEYVGKESVFGTDRLTQLIRTTVESRVHASYPLPQN